MGVPLAALSSLTLRKVLSNPTILNGKNMTYWDHYLIPSTIDEALSILTKANGNARVIAGGTDLFLDLRQGRHPRIGTLVDITGIPELGEIQLKQTELFVGSAVTHRQILENPHLKEHARCLIEACSLIAGPQVRNVATIGGNVAHALPAADGSVALLALGAEAEIASYEGRRWVKVEDLFLGPGEPSFDPKREVLLRFRLPFQKPNERSAFHRVMRPQGVAIAILNMALWVRLYQDHQIDDIRIAVGPAGPVPFRALETEAFLRGTRAEQSRITEAIVVLQAEAKVRTSSHRATREYRKHLLGVLFTHLIQQILDQDSRGEQES